MSSNFQLDLPSEYYIDSIVIKSKITEKEVNIFNIYRSMVIHEGVTYNFMYGTIHYNPYKTDWWKLVNSNHYVDRAGWVDIYADSKGANVMALDILYKNDVTPCHQTT